MNKKPKTNMLVINILFFALLMTLLFNPVFQLGINVFLSDIFVILIFIVFLLRIFSLFKTKIGKKFFSIFIFLLFYYLIIISFSIMILNNSFSAVMGRFRHLYFYPLLLFPGLISVKKKNDIK